MQVKRPKKDTGFYSTISIAIVLFLMCIYGLLFLHATNISNLIKEKINIIVELSDELTKEQQDLLISIINKKEIVKSNSVQYLPKESAMEFMKDYISDADLDSGSLPFKDVITFNIKSEMYEDQMILQLSNELRKENGVVGVYAENETVALVKNSIQKISFISLSVGFIFIILALAIIYNTIKLRLHADRHEIKTMQLVGATRVFIAKPYLKEAFSIAWNAFLIVASLVGVVILALVFNVEFFKEIINWMYVAAIYIIILAFGIILSVGIARIVVKGYLDQKTLDLY
jgi:cell division transport system permease protein